MVNPGVDGYTEIPNHR